MSSLSIFAVAVAIVWTLLLGWWVRYQVRRVIREDYEPERSMDEISRDDFRFDWLQDAAEEGCVTMCFDIDGGVHATFERIDGKTFAARNAETIREAIDQLKKSRVLMHDSHAAETTLRQRDRLRLREGEIPPLDMMGGNGHG